MSGSRSSHSNLADLGWALLVATSTSTGCGALKPAEAPRAAGTAEGPSADAKPPAKPAESAVVAPKIPTECASKDGDFCAMPAEFVKRLCNGVRLDMALVLFQKSTPWARGYLTRNTDAWNAEGGATSAGTVAFDEEVLLLKSKAPPKGGMQVSGMGGYQALRWDGSCVTLESEEVTPRRPPKPKHPRIDVRYIDDPIKEALRKDAAVDAAFLAQRNECKGVGVGDVTKKCVVLDAKLGDEIVKYVEANDGLPNPTKIP